MAFQLDEGFSVSFDFTVGLAYFGTRAEYNNGDTCLLILEGEDENGEDKSMFMSVGKGWAASDDSRLAIHHDQNGIPDGKTTFLKTSHVGRFINALLELGAGADMEKHTEHPNGTGADTYIGLKMHIETVEVDYGKELGKKRIPLPTAFLGYEDDGAPTQAAPAQAQAPAASVEGASVRESVIAVAKSQPDHASFTKIAFTLPGVASDPELMAEIANPAGIFATANA